MEESYRAERPRAQRSRRSQAHLASLGALVAVILLATPALAAGPTIKVDPKRVPRGEVVRVFGVVPGCARGNQVTLISRAFSRAHEFAGVPAVFARVGRRHRYSVRTRIPRRRDPRRYRISGRCGGGNLGVVARVRVLR